MPTCAGQRATQRWLPVKQRENRKRGVAAQELNAVTSGMHQAIIRGRIKHASSDVRRYMSHGPSACAQQKQWNGGGSALGRAASGAGLPMLSLSIAFSFIEFLLDRVAVVTFVTPVRRKSKQNL